MEDEPGVGLRLLREVGQQASLADTRLPCHQRDPTGAATGIRQPQQQRLDLRLAPNQWEAAWRSRHTNPPWPRCKQPASAAAASISGGAGAPRAWWTAQHSRERALGGLTTHPRHIMVYGLETPAALSQ